MKRMILAGALAALAVLAVVSIAGGGPARVQQMSPLTGGDLPRSTG